LAAWLVDQRSIAQLATIGQAQAASIGIAQKQTFWTARGRRKPDDQRMAYMSVDRQNIEALVFEYLARGGRVLKVPGAIPATREEVLRYLKAQKVNLAAARRKLMNDPDALIKLANVHRRSQGQPPFQRG